MGCVLPAGLGEAPARQAALDAGLAQSVPATTVNKMCGSAMKAVMFAADGLRTGDSDFAVAGGLESMTNAPYLCPRPAAAFEWAMAKSSTTCSSRPAKPMGRPADGLFRRKHGAKVRLYA